MLLLSAKCLRHPVRLEDMMKGASGESFKGPVVPFGVMVEYHPIFCKRPVKAPQNL